MRVIDLTHTMEIGMPVYPGDPFFRSRSAAEHEADGFFVSDLAFGSHTGTHLDFPFHRFEDGEVSDDFLLETFWLKAAAVDLTEMADRFCFGMLPPLIVPELLRPFEPVFLEAEAVILKTGWSRRWGESDFYTAFPSLLPETAEWLAERSIRLLGLETPSLSALDHYTPEDGPLPASLSSRCASVESLFLHADAESHRILLGRTPPVLLLENLLCPDELPAILPPLTDSWREGLFTLAAFPLRLHRGDASPVRAAAIVETGAGERNLTGLGE